ncbi:MAG: hypothetical protein PHQ27_11405 [Victivallales bacterium]|nr:hypothetical protein [Victivallales bacterium]
MSELQETIAAWQNAVEKLEHSVRNRNFYLFLAARRNVNRVYNGIQEILESNLRRESLSPSERETILAATRRWQRLTGTLRDWQDELQKEIGIRHRERVVNKKISQAYNDRGLRPGHKVRLSR